MALCFNNFTFSTRKLGLLPEPSKSRDGRECWHCLQWMHQRWTYKLIKADQYLKVTANLESTKRNISQLQNIEHRVKRRESQANTLANSTAWSVKTHTKEAPTADISQSSPTGTIFPTIFQHILVYTYYTNGLTKIMVLWIKAFYERSNLWQNRDVFRTSFEKRIGYLEIYQAGKAHKILISICTSLMGTKELFNDWWQIWWVHISES